MVDFHSHIVFGVDDGAKTIDDSVKMVFEARKAGFTDVIFTPHYFEGYYEISKEEISQKIQLIKEAVEEKGLKIRLHQGNEIYITDRITEFLNNGLASSIGNSKYVLFETPMREEPFNLNQIIYQLLEAKKVPIIAHPERYLYIQENPNLVYELIQNGVLFQSNFGSLVGIYGKTAQKTVNLLLKHNMIHFMGSDVHRPNSAYTVIGDALSELRKILPEDEVKNITYENALKVLNNEEIETEEPTEIKKNLFGKFI